jgi:hypothetical protein
VTARTVFVATRPSMFPAPAGTSVTVTARLDEDTLGIHWERSDLPTKNTLALTTEEFDGIARALGYVKKTASAHPGRTS